MGKKQKKKETMNVEFGQEFGDVNAAKQLEMVSSNKGSTNKSRKKK